MSRRRSRPSETKASARFDLLCRVIFAAFTLALVSSIPDPGFLIQPASLALSKQANPRGKEPAGYQTTRADENTFPNNEREKAVGNRSTRNRIASRDKEEMQRADKQ